VSGRVRRRAELGQHFLAGGRLAAELVEQAGVGSGDLVVEIGAGTGVLTEALARRAGRVVAVECDPRLAERARVRLAGFGNVWV
jgi:16S rRNA A1518/A1519 N6-dimethyltransferase RsmA/KsgA/DIM1 with predicted DNA glycosylase/AP lyase activity